jgi:hypothetical protein
MTVMTLLPSFAAVFIVTTFNVCKLGMKQVLCPLRRKYIERHSVALSFFFKTEQK